MVQGFKFASQLHTNCHPEQSEGSALVDGNLCGCGAEKVSRGGDGGARWHPGF